MYSEVLRGRGPAAEGARLYAKGVRKELRAVTDIDGVELSSVKEEEDR